MSDSDVHCVNWLEEYFKNYGDAMPNRDEIRLSICTKKELHELYMRSRKDLQFPVVSYSQFCNLWNTLFPNCKIRSWVDIPGKCEVCYEIDTLRRKSENINVQMWLSKAHVLHRGGMFMLERKA